jgi:hypothetical protein
VSFCPRLLNKAVTDQHGEALDEDLGHGEPSAVHKTSIRQHAPRTVNALIEGGKRAEALVLGSFGLLFDRGLLLLLPFLLFLLLLDLLLALLLSAFGLGREFLCGVQAVASANERIAVDRPAAR